MLKLIKHSNNWEEWEVQYREKSYVLGPISNVIDHQLYEFPGSLDLKITTTDIGHLSFRDLPENIQLTVLIEDGELRKNITQAKIQTISGKVEITFLWEILIKEWKVLYNPFLFVEEFVTLITNFSEKAITYSIGGPDHTDEYIDIYIDLTCELDRNIQDIFNTNAVLLNNTFEQVNEKMLIGGYLGKVVSKFSFGENIQYVCTRYLQYFIEFLKDMGIEANSSIRQSGRDILFSVEPVSADIALEKISKALAIYLKLPDLDIQSLESSFDDPFVELKFEKLRSEIAKLKADISMQKALIKYQGEMISKSSALTKELPSECLKKIIVNNKDEEPETYLGGAIKLGVYKKAGIEIDWSAFINWIKKK